jgi:DNA-binding CsgD family transcriptional regulator
VKHHLKKVYAKVGTNSREQVLLQYERWLVAKGKNAA